MAEQNIPLGEMAPRLNAEFGLDWGSGAYWRRARRHDIKLPTRPGRLGTEQCQQLDKRIRELVGDEKCGSEIRTILNSEFGLNWELQTYRLRVLDLGLKWPFTPRAGRSKAGKLSERERIVCYQDPAYEARNHLANEVICRECFAVLHGELGRHLPKIHPDIRSNRKYRQLHPGAPLFSWAALAHKEGRNCEEVMREVAEKYALPEERAAAAADPEYEDHNRIRDYVICREDRCGLKAASLNSHIPRAHGKTVKAYRRGHNWPEITCAETRETRQKNREARRTGNEELLSKGGKAFWNRFKQMSRAETVAREQVERLTQELKQAKAELAKARATKANMLPVAEVVRAKTADPNGHPWMSPNEVAAAFGISPATFYRYRKEGLYTRLRPNTKGWYSTVSAIAQLNKMPKNSRFLSH
jgi:hypothetical protein